MARRLAAILAADVVGYSRLMEVDESGTLAALRAHRQELIDPKIAAHDGRTVKLMGDGALVEFASVVDAVACAVEIQRGMAQRNDAVAEDRRIQFRIGVHLGDVIVEDEDIYGDGVNVAARLEGLAEPGGICISQQAYDQVETKLDLGYQDLGEQQVKNLARPVRVIRVLAEPDRAAAAAGKRRKSFFWPLRAVAITLGIVIAAAGALAWWQLWRGETDRGSRARSSGREAIAVLPFDNMSGDPQQDYFSDGITEDLTTDLSQVSGLFVAARNSTFTYKGRPVNAQQVGRELGVDYVLEGSVRKAGNTVRINAQLVDAHSGGHLWAERFDRELTDIFALQDEVTQKIVSALAVTLTPEEKQQLSQAAKAHPEAYDLVLRGLERFRRFTRETNVEAREYFERAVAIDPKFARAHADLALTHAEELFHRWTDSPERSSRLALDEARYALTLDDTSLVGHFALAFTYLNVKRYDEAVIENRRVQELDPNFPDGQAQRGLILNQIGKPAEGLKAIQAAMRLDPRHPFFYVWILGQSYFLLGQTDEAIAQFSTLIARNPAFVVGHLMLAAAYAQAGRIADAEWQAQEVLVLNPDFSLADERNRAAYKDPSNLEYYLEGLRKAGLPK